MNKYILFVPLIIVSVLVFMPKNKSETTMMSSIDKTQVVETMAESNEKIEFTGEKGEIVELKNGQINIDSTNFETNVVKFFNTTLVDGKTIYFLVLKDINGNFRAAANANKQCAAFGKGYRQVGDEIECLTCNKKYPLSDFAVAQPDCNPFPISTKLPIVKNQIVINLSELETVASLF